MATTLNYDYPVTPNFVTTQMLANGGDPGAVLSGSPTGGVGYATGAGTTVTQASFTLTSVAVVGTAGQCTVTAPATNLQVGQAVAITGTLTGTATGIVTSTTYYIIATNGSTTFTLSGTRGGAAITTTAGTTTGFTFTINGSSTRTTAIYANNVAGSITLVSAAGSTTPATFTVNNSTVGAADTIDIVQASGANLYQVFITNVAAGSFNITFFTTGGTTTEQPVFNYTVQKGATS
jgi:hypothetical protein